MIKDYLRLMIFAAGLLIGVQVPGFISEYQKRVDAHWVEASKNLSGFLDSADKFFAGDVAALIRHYENSNDRVFIKDAENIRALNVRVEILSIEVEALNKPWYQQASHVFMAADEEILKETLTHYGYTVPLNEKAIAWGLSVAVVLAVIVDLLLAIFYRLLVSPFQNKKAHQ